MVVVLILLLVLLLIIPRRGAPGDVPGLRVPMTVLVVHLGRLVEWRQPTRAAGTLLQAHNTVAPPPGVSPRAGGAARSAPRSRGPSGGCDFRTMHDWTGPAGDAVPRQLGA